MKLTQLTPSMKIAIGWSAVIAVGLSSFVLARDSVVSNRKALLDMKRRIRDQAKNEAEIEMERKAEERELSSAAKIV